MRNKAPLLAIALATLTVESAAASPRRNVEFEKTSREIVEMVRTHQKMLRALETKDEVGELSCYSTSGGPESDEDIQCPLPKAMLGIHISPPDAKFPHTTFSAAP